LEGLKIFFFRGFGAEVPFLAKTFVILLASAICCLQIAIERLRQCCSAGLLRVQFYGLLQVFACKSAMSCSVNVVVSSMWLCYSRARKKLLRRAVGRERALMGNQKGEMTCKQEREALKREYNAPGDELT